MEIKALKNRPDFTQDKKKADKYAGFGKLLTALRERDVPESIVSDINAEIDTLNRFSGSKKDFSKQLRKSKSAILKVVEKELNWVAQNHYQHTWMALGMTVFGLPFGAIFGMSMDNMAFLGIGLPIGMAIGIAIGTSMDSKAKEEGRQLAVDA